MIKITTEEHKTLRALEDKVREAEDRYLELRDAKSDGCCAGKTINAVLAYDKQIEAAADNIHICQSVVDTYRSYLSRRDTATQCMSDEGCIKSYADPQPHCAECEWNEANRG